MSYEIVYGKQFVKSWKVERAEVKFYYKEAI